MCFAMVIQNGGVMPGEHPRRSTFSAPATKQNGGNPLSRTFAGILPYEPSRLSNSVAPLSSARLPLSSRPSLSSKIPTSSLGSTSYPKRRQMASAQRLRVVDAVSRSAGVVRDPRRHPCIAIRTNSHLHCFNTSTKRGALTCMSVLRTRGRWQVGMLHCII